MSSLVVVARIISSSFCLFASTDATWDESARARSRPHRANALCPRGLDEVVLEGPDRCGGTAADAGLLVDVLDVVPDGLGGDAEIVGDRLVRVAEHERQQHFQL